MDSNHDKEIQILLCYHYTIGQEQGPKSVGLVGGVKRLYPQASYLLPFSQLSVLMFTLGVNPFKP
jgi:hypothetical protein